MPDEPTTPPEGQAASDWSAFTEAGITPDRAQEVVQAYQAMQDLNNLDKRPQALQQLVRPDLDAVGDAIGLSRETLRIIKQNLAWAFGYNTAAIPLAAFGLLNPMIAGATMALSSVLVVSNSLRLKRWGR